MTPIAVGVSAAAPRAPSLGSLKEDCTDHPDGIEPVQVAEYGVGAGHYDAHMDASPAHARTGLTPEQRYNFGLEIGSRQRVISVSIQLSAPDSYQGGRLVVGRGAPAAVGLGDAIMFPSYNFHRVEPVTSGVRWSLVAWAFATDYDARFWKQ